MTVATAFVLRRSWQHRVIAIDDAMIYGRYFNNFFAGHGLVYNVGERFNGLTSPFYAYVMMAIGKPFSDVLDAMWLVSMVGTLAALWLLFDFGRRRGDALGYSIGLLMVACNQALYSVYGMETGLFLGLIAACLWCYQCRRHYALAVLAALLVLTRNEGVFLLVAIGADHLLTRRRLPSWQRLAASWKTLIAPGVIVAAHLLFIRLYYGAFMAETGKAKIWQGKSRYFGTQKPLFLHVDFFWQDYLHGSKLLWWGLLLLAVAGIAANLRRNLPLVLFAVLFTTFYCVLNIPGYTWYYGPLILILFVLAGTGIAALARLLVRALPKAGWRTVPQTALAVVAVAALIWLPQDPKPGPAPAVPDPPLDRTGMNHRAGVWLSEHVGADKWVSASEIGQVGYYSPVKIVDVLGLVNKDNARYIGQRDIYSWLKEYHPDYLLIHTPVWPFEDGVQLYLDRGELWQSQDFDVPGLVLYCQPHEPGCAPLPPPSGGLKAVAS